MAFTKKERDEFLKSIRLGIESCSDEGRIGTLKVNMQSGEPKWARISSHMRAGNDKKPKSCITVDNAMIEVEKLISKVKYGVLHININAGMVIDVVEESQLDLWVNKAQ